MSKHLADHRSAPSAARMKRFMAIERGDNESSWRAAWQRPSARVAGNRRLVEYVRISRMQSA